MAHKALEWAWRMMGQLLSEPSLYDSYVLFNGKSDALWYFLCFALGGLAGALFLKKEGA